MKKKQVISIVLAAALITAQPLTSFASFTEVNGVDVPGGTDISNITVETDSNALRTINSDFFEVKQPNDRKEYDFNSNWKFINHDDENARQIDYDESGAETVGLPHSTVDYDLYDVNTKEVYVTTWYRRHFTLPESEQGNQVKVQFEGGGQINRVYVNGGFVGEATGTFTQFTMDISDYITYGDYDNVISVQVDSHPYWGKYGPNGAPDFYFLGGMHGEAKMIITDPLYVDNVYYTTNGDRYESDGAVTLNGEVVVKNDYMSAKECDVTAVLTDADGQEAASVTKTVTVGAEGDTTVSFSTDVAAPHLWTMDDPYLYQLTTSISVRGTHTDSKEINFGLRWVSVDSANKEDGYMYLNGKPMSHIPGVARHTQSPYVGNSSPRIMEVKDAYLIKEELGCDIVRTSHYTTTTAFLDECDRIGLLVEAESFGFSGMPKDAYEHYLREMILRDRNHPSIVMWNVIPNESELGNYPMDWRMDSAAIVKELDPTRIPTQEEWMYSANKQIPGVVFSYHEYRSRAGHEKPPAPDLPVVIGEYNDYTGASFTTSGSSETRKISSLLHDSAKINSFQQYKGIIAYMKWAFAGYYTPRSIDVNSRNRGAYRFAGIFGPLKDTLNMNWFGTLNLAQSDRRPVLMIANENSQVSDRTVYVISNYPKAALYANGEAVTSEPIEPNYLTSLPHPMYEFHLPESYVWSPESVLEAIGYDEEGNEQQRSIQYASAYDTVVDGASVELYNTTGKYREKTFQQDENIIYANNSDVAYLIANVQDKNGQSQYYADGIPSVEVEGVGKAVYGGTLYMDDGVSGFYIRSSDPGDTTVKVSVDTGVTYDDDVFTYTGSWEKKDNIDTTTRDPNGSFGGFEEDYIYSYLNEAYGGSVQASSAKGDTASYTFEGTRIALYSTIRFTQGDMEVSIDGGPAQKVNMNASSIRGTDSNHRVYLSEELEPGEHTITVKVLGSNSGGSDGGSGGPHHEVQIDSVKVFDGIADLVSDPITITAVEEDYAAVLLPKEGAPKAPSADGMFTKASLSRMISEAQAIDIDLVTEESAQVLLAAIEEALEVLNKAAASEEEIKEAVRELDEAVKGLVFMTDLQIPYNSIGDNNQFRYTSEHEDTWLFNNEKPGYAYTSAEKRSPGDSYSISFTGDNLELYAWYYPGGGIAEVSMDGEDAERIDLYRETGERNLLKSFSGLDMGRHVAVVRVTGEKDIAASDADVTCAGAVIRGTSDPWKEIWVALKHKIQEAEALNRSECGLEELEELDNAYYAALALMESGNASEEELTEALNALTEALENAAANMEQVIWYDDSDAVSYSTNEWVSESGHSEAGNKYLPAGSVTPEKYFEVTFEGTAIDLYSRYNENNGYIAVSIDGGEEEEISLYQTPRETKIFKTYTDLENGVHTVKIRATGKKDGGAKAGLNFVKAVVPPAVIAPTTVWYDDKTDDPSGEAGKVYYSTNEWTAEFGHEEGGNMYLPVGKVTDEKYFLVTFTGTAIDLYSRFNENNGFIWVSLDGGTEEKISLYKGGARETKIFKSYFGLDDDLHTVKVRAANEADFTGGGTKAGVNFVKGVIPLELDHQIDLSALRDKIDKINAVEQGDALDKVWNTFKKQIEALTDGTLLSGLHPNIVVADRAPAGVTSRQVEKIMENLNKAMAVLGLVYDREIVRIVYPKDIWVETGTEFEALDLPKMIISVLEDETSLEIPVTWKQGSYDNNLEDCYEIYGELALPEGILNHMVHVPSIRITVTAPEIVLYPISVTVEGGDAAVAASGEAPEGGKVTVMIGGINEDKMFDSIKVVLAEDEDGEETVDENHDLPDSDDSTADSSDETNDDPVASPSDAKEDITAESADDEITEEADSRLEQEEILQSFRIQLTEENLEVITEELELPEEIPDVTAIEEDVDERTEDESDGMNNIEESDRGNDRSGREAGDALTLTTVKEGAEYSFIMPAAPVEITVTLKDKPKEPDKPEEPEKPDTPHKPQSSSNSGRNSYVSGWRESGRGWRYREAGKDVVSNWKYIIWNGTQGWYYFGADGYMVTGWFPDSTGEWFYLNPVSDGTGGMMKTGWLFDGMHWYYLNPVSDGTMGRMVTGWNKIEEKWYYFNEVSDGTKGALLLNGTAPGGYIAGAEGAVER